VKKVYKARIENGDDMVASTEVLDALKSIGLNLYERKIFVALLAKGVATAAEVSEIASVPRSRSYDVLESLAEKGFVMIQPAKPIRYVVHKPSEGLERTKESLRRKHDHMVERIDKLLAGSLILQELESIYKQGLSLVEPTEMTGTLKGRHIINRQLNSAFKDAKSKIAIMTSDRGLQELRDTHFRALKKASKNGVKIRIMAPLKNGAGEFASIADIRNIDEPLGRFAIIDDEQMLVALTDDKNVHETQDVALWASSPHAAGRFAKPLFEHAWTQAK